MVWPLHSLRPHPQAGELPRLSAADLAALKQDVREHGLQVPLAITAEGEVLDGQARLQVATELGLEELPVRVVATEDPLSFMLRAALVRRHLSPSQKAA